MRVPDTAPTIYPPTHPGNKGRRPEPVDASAALAPRWPQPAGAPPHVEKHRHDGERRQGERRRSSQPVRFDMRLGDRRGAETAASTVHYEA